MPPPSKPAPRPPSAPAAAPAAAHAAESAKQQPSRPEQETTGQETQNARLFTNAPALGYLPDEDRHLSKAKEPLYSFAIIGCGIMGTEHIRNTLLEGRARIGGLFDPSPASVAQAQQAVGRYGQLDAAREYVTIEELCADPSIDAIFICTPNYTHLSVLRSIVAAGKAIFLEKPIATTVADAWSVCQLATAHSQLVRFGLQYRYKAIYAEAVHEVVERQSIGRVHAIHMHEHRFPFLDKVGQWNKFNEFSGGTLIEKCCHYFDLLNLFAQGTPVKVYASGHQAVNFKKFNYQGRAADGLDHASVIIDYDNHVVGNFELCMFAPGSSEQLIINGDRGRLRAEESSTLGSPNKNTLEIWRGERGASTLNHPHYPPYIEEAGHHGSTFYEHAAFVDDLAAQSSTGPSLADGFWSVAVGAAAHQSITEGRAVLLEEVLPDDFDPAVLVGPMQ